MNKKVISKGYTLEVVSWENDGDDYRTKSVTVDTIEEAKGIYNMCMTLFKSCNKGEGCIGNSPHYNTLKITPIIISYFKEHPELYLDKPITDDEDLINLCRVYACTLLGGGEYYEYRVCESCTCYYSPEDIYLEEIKF